MERIRVNTGLALPFYPMRPSKRQEIKTAAAAAEVAARAAAAGALLQPKLNGDRVELGKKDGRLMFANRHGNWYQFSVKNAAAWQAVPDGTVLDGEVWKGNFHPFEAIAVGAELLAWKCPTVRAAAAAKLCLDLGQTYLFAPLDAASLELLRSKWSGVVNPEWEGAVWKDRNSPYVCLGAENKESAAWMKYRWV